MSATVKSAICPKCFAQTTEDKWVYTCRRDNCRAKGNAVPAAQAVKGRGDAPACPECGDLYASPLCPLCGFPVHEENPDSAALSVTLVGAAGSGKSCFLATLIDEMKNRMAKTYDCALFPSGGDDTIALYEKQYYKPLYERGHVPEPTTQDDVNPLMYSLVFQKEPNTKTLDLIFYDSCGANFESISAMSNANRSLYHSGGILFLIDPTQLPVMREWAASHNGKICDADAVALLTRTVQTIRTGSGQKLLKQKIETPIAVCITKLDEARPLLDASSFMLANTRHFREDKFDKLDFNACSMEAQSLIEAWGGGEIVRQVTSQFSDFAFFGLSALGDAPSQAGGVHHIAPHRVTDPMLWLLHKNKAIR